MKGSLGEVREQWIYSVSANTLPCARHLAILSIRCTMEASFERSRFSPGKSEDIKTPAVQCIAKCFGLSSVL